MSYTIEYNRAIYKDDKEWNGEFNYYLFIRQGDNNCYELNGQRVKNWEFITCGWAYNIIDEICKRAGSCEGGSLQRAKGFRGSYCITPEEYIALYRKEIKKAKPIKELFKDFYIDVYIEAPKKPKEDDLKDWRKREIIELLKTAEKDGWEIGENYYYKEIATFRKVIKNLKEFKEYIGKKMCGDGYYLTFSIRKEAAI